MTKEPMPEFNNAKVIREIKEIKVKESPTWLSSFLMASGTRSINNIVDIGNYVMLLTGQPLHMYDADKLAKAELIARSDYEGDFVALDEKTYAVKNGDIVITCDGVPQCLGGVMGSLGCAVDENTKNIYIESASFDGATIRRTSNRLGLASESSSRFVKGTNHFQAEFVLDFATELIVELCEAKECSNIVTYQSEVKADDKLASSVTRINGRLGTEFTAEQIKDALVRLHFGVEFKNENEFVATIPHWRLDVSCDADLCEEVIRLLGFENVKSILPRLDTHCGVLTPSQSKLQEIRFFLLGKGLDECVTYSLVSKKEANLFNLLNNEEHYSIINPLTDEHEVFRTHVLHSLLKVATYNVARQNKNLMLFETSNMISKSSRAEHLAIVLVGNQEHQGAMKKEPFDFYHMKGLVDGIMSSLGIELSRYKYEVASSHLDELHPGKSAEIIFQNQVIGMFGELHPTQIGNYDLGKTKAVVLEMNLEPLLNAKVGITKMTPISRFPSVQRDLAFVVKKDVMVRDIVRTIKFTGRGLVSDASVFDVYEGTGIESGYKSIAITVTYTKADATLTEREVSDMEDKIKFDLTKTYKAELRG